LDCANIQHASLPNNKEDTPTLPSVIKNEWEAFVNREDLLKAEGVYFD